MLVDCGTGTFARLLRHRSLASIDGLFLSHSHLDHWLDLLAIRHALAHSPVPLRREPLLVLAPGQLHATLLAVGRAMQPDDRFWPENIHFEACGPSGEWKVGDLQLIWTAVRHPVPTLALRVECHGRSLVYTADSGPCAALEELADGADLLLAESTLLTRQGHEDVWGHLSAAEAGALARRSRAGALLLTHLWPGYQAADLIAAAQTEYDGPVSIAREDETRDIP